MKKIVGIIAALAMVAGIAFADDPSVVPSVVSFSGKASIEYDINLNDPAKMGIVNASETEFKITFVPKDFKKSTEGSDLWGELVIKTGDQAHEKGIGSVYTIPAVSIDTAKIHFSDDDFYVIMNILAPGLEVGGGDILTATWSAKAFPKAAVTLTNKAGFTLNFGLTDLVDFNLQYADNGVVEPKAKKVAFVFDASIKAVEGLTFNAGVGYGTEKEKLVAAVKADYKVGITDTMYVKPAVGFALNEAEAKNLTAGVLFGWGADGLEPSFAKFKGAYTKDIVDADGKVTNKLGSDGEWDNVPNKTADGVSVFVDMPLADKAAIGLLVSAYDSTFVEGLKVGAEFWAPNVTDMDKAGWVADFALAYGSGDLLGDWVLSANFGLEAEKLAEVKTGFLWGVGLENGAIIENTTLYLKYAGQAAKDIQKMDGSIKGIDDNGTIKIGAQIHF